MSEKSSNTPSNTTQQEKLGPRVSSQPQVQEKNDGKIIYPEKVSIIHKENVPDFNPFAIPAGRYAKKDAEFKTGKLTDIKIDSNGFGKNHTITYTVKLDDSGKEIKIIVGKEVPDYFFMVEDPPSGGKNKRKNRKSTKSKKSKKSKKSRKNRKKTIRRR